MKEILGKIACGLNIHNDKPISDEYKRKYIPKILHKCIRCKREIMKDILYDGNIY